MTSERSVTKTRRSREHMLSLMRTLLLFVLAYPAIAQAPPHLTAQQEAVARRLEGMLIAPCCFANTVAEHRSPISDEIRDQIRVAVASGKTETEILDAFVAKYGERILAAPKPQGFNLLAYVLPAVAIAVGLLIIAFVMCRHRAQAPNAEPPSEIPDQIKARFEAELAHFDE
jgi:cytochrome c-type biogenesis protein CcmH